MILILVSQVFTGVQFIVVEKLLSDYYLDPFIIVGNEGMWGLMYYLIVLTPMQIFTCTKWTNNYEAGTGGALAGLCSFGYMENSAYAFYQMKNNGWLIVETFGSILSIACFNSFGIGITKYASAAHRAVTDTSRTILVWILCTLLGYQKLEWPSATGFLLVLLGTLVYNEILIIPFFGFDENTKEAIAKRNRENPASATDANYVSLSPHAAYDAQRQKRALQGGQKDINVTADLGKDDHDYMIDEQ